MKRDSDESWEHINCDGEDLHGTGSDGIGWAYVDRAIADVVGALEEGDESELSGRNVLKATEIIFGAWESSRKHGRVEIPLAIEDNPLDAMIDAGALSPAATEDD